MSREWQPGDVAVVLATFGPKDNAPSEYVASHNHDGWTLLADRAEYWLDGNDDYDCKPVRPLVVIDPEDREAVERLLSAYLEHGWTRTPDDAPIRTTGIDYLQAALREYANPKPRIDEPQGLGAVVEDEDGNRWMRHEPDPGRGNRNHAWYPAGYVSDGVRVKWDRITAVRVLSPGVEVDQ